MSNAATLTLGAGAGLGLWYLWHRKGHSLTAQAPKASATYGELMVALGRAGIPTCTHRNAARRRQAKAPSRAETSTVFTLVTYTQGFKASPRLRWFRAEKPITWAAARDRLGAAGLDLSLAGRTREPGGWILSTEPHHFRGDRAEALPGAAGG